MLATPAVLTTPAVQVPSPRLYILRKWPDFMGYGFDLYDEKNNPGHMIGGIDPGSPAQAAGLQKGDKIIEVNGQNVLEDSHQQVVDQIKKYDEEVTILVIDSNAEKYYNDKSLWIHGKMDNITVIEGPTERPAGKHTCQRLASLHHIVVALVFINTLSCGCPLGITYVISVCFTTESCCCLSFLYV